MTFIAWLSASALREFPHTSDALKNLEGLMFRHSNCPAHFLHYISHAILLGDPVRCGCAARVGAGKSKNPHHHRIYSSGHNPILPANHRHGKHAAEREGQIRSRGLRSGIHSHLHAAVSGIYARHVERCDAGVFHDLDDLAKQENFVASIGPALMADKDDPAQAQLLAEILSQTTTLFGSVVVAGR